MEEEKLRKVVDFFVKFAQEVPGPLYGYLNSKNVTFASYADYIQSLNADTLIRIIDRI
jgi:hypothetical protein